MALQLDAQAARKRRQRVFGRAVDHAEPVDLTGRNRGHDDDVAAPPFHHRLRHPMRDPERGEHISAEHCLAIRVGHIKERGVFEYAGIVDEKVDVARGARQFTDETAIIQSPAMVSTALPHCCLSASSCARRRPVARILAPACASAMAVARPMPALAPVTSTVFPDNGMPVSFPPNPDYT